MSGPRELDLNARRHAYGASELAALHGLDPWLDLHTMYLRKIEGVVEPPTERQLYGKAFEEAILYVFNVKTGKKFRPMFNETFKHPEFPRYKLIGSPDGMPEDESDGGVDCKWVAWDQSDQWGLTAYDIPPRVELQVRGYMAIMQKPRWYVALWCGDRMRIYTVERDVEFEKFILDGAEETWQRYFEARVRPPIGGSQLSTDWLKRIYPRHKRPEPREATEDEIVLLDRYSQLRRQQHILQDERDPLENQIKEAIKDDAGLVWPGGKFMWRRTKDSTSIDWESLAIALRTKFIKDPDPQKEEAMRKEVTDNHTRTKEGVRKIWFRATGYEEREVPDAAA